MQIHGVPSDLRGICTVANHGIERGVQGDLRGQGYVQWLIIAWWSKVQRLSQLMKQPKLSKERFAMKGYAAVLYSKDHQIV